MSNLIDQASLVMIPSGYKEDKIYSQVPTDGSGDIQFTRASDGTRVNSQGLVERVPWNLLEQSNQFDTTWGKQNVTLTSGQSGYDGTNNAWLLTTVASQGRVQQTLPTTSGIYTLSCYMKQGTNTRGVIRMNQGGSEFVAYFELDSGTAAAVSGNVIASAIESVGGGWYRCSAAFITATSSNSIGFGSAASGSNWTATTSGNIYIQDAQLNEGSTAKPYFPTTDRLNVPRLDYSGGCPSLLLEPQRTNILTYSEQFDNAAWSKENATITANSIISPSGLQDADTLTDNTTSGRHRLQSGAISFVSGTAYTYSVFVKKNSSGRFLLINAASGANARAALNLDTLEITNINGTGKVEDYGDGWYRFSVTGTATATASQATYIQMQNSASDVNYVGDGSSFYIWGAQLEEGSYPTSYIPTTSASVTRVADAATADIASILTSNAGTLFIHLDNKANSGGYSSGALSIGLQDATSANLIGWASNSPSSLELRGIYRVGGVTTFLGASTTINTESKILIKWGGGFVKFFKNGALFDSQVVTDFTGQPLEDYLLPNAARTGNFPINQTVIFPTALTDAECISLTTL